jgi:CBS domain-containing protein
MNSGKTVADYMTDRIVVFEPTMDLMRAMRVMIDSGISGAPVVDEQGALVGILTEKDCFRAAFEMGYHRDLVGPVSRYMSYPVETVAANADIVAAVDRFHRNRYRRLPVVEDNRVVGVLSRRDVLVALEELL